MFFLILSLDRIGEIYPRNTLGKNRREQKIDLYLQVRYYKGRKLKCVPINNCLCKVCVLRLNVGQSCVFEMRNLNCEQKYGACSQLFKCASFATAAQYKKQLSQTSSAFTQGVSEVNLTCPVSYIGDYRARRDWPLFRWLGREIALQGNTRGLYSL